MTRLALFIFFAALPLSGPLPALRGAITTTGNVTPNPPGSWTSSTTGYVGKTTDGTVTVNAGSDLHSRHGYIGYNSGVTGEVTITGTGSMWTNESQFFVGDSGSGRLNIIGSAYVYSGSCAYVGNNSGSTGAVTVDGAGSMWCSSRLYVGDFGDGKLDITGGAYVSNSTGSHIGYGLGSTGIVTLDGNDSAWCPGDSLYVGHSGSGTLTVTNGAIIRGWISRGYIGYDSGATGAVTVDGTSAKFHSLYVGSGGSGTLAIEALQFECHVLADNFRDALW